MKIRSIALALCVLAVAATAASAATSEVGLNAGVTLPMGDFGDAVGTGFFGGGSYTYHVNEMFGLGADINYHKFGKKDFTFNGSTVSDDFSAIQYGVHGKYFFKMKTKEMPYIKVGLGMYSLSEKASSTVNGVDYSATVTDSKFGISAGIGSDWAMSDKASWGIEALYHNIMTDNKSSAMITVGARYNWMMK